MDYDKINQVHLNVWYGGNQQCQNKFVKGYVDRILNYLKNAIFEKKW